MFHVKQSLEIISWAIMLSGGLLLAAALLAACGLVLAVVGERFWNKVKAIYLLNRMHWALADLQKHGKVLPRPDMPIGVDDET